MARLLKAFTTAGALLCMGFNTSAFAAGDLVAEMSLQFSRYVHAASRSTQGEPDAARLVGLASGKFNTALDTAIHGGQYQNCTYAPAPQAAQAQLGKVFDTWKHYQQLGDAIQQNQPAMQEFISATNTIIKNTPELLEASEQAAMMIVIQGNPPTNVAAAGQLEMLVERIANSANSDRLESYVNPEATFLLGKDTNTMHDIMQGLQNGSKALRTTPVKADAREKLNAAAAVLDKDIEARDIIMKDLKPAVAVRSAAAELDARYEAFYQQLQMLSGSLPPAQDCR